MRLPAVFGPEPLARLSRVHAVSTAADACITVSLAGSLFFSVSVDAARPRLALYLVLTLAPFAVVAPLIGPLTDRFRRSQPAFVAFTGQARAILALFIAVDLRTLLLYPESFGVLVLGRSYSIVRRGLVPTLVPDDDQLVAANARLSRVGSLAGAIGGGTGVLVLELSGSTAVLRLAALLHIVGAALALRIPHDSARPADAEEDAEHGMLAPAPHVSARLRGALLAMAVLRGTTGLLTFLIAFALKRDGEPLAFFGVVALAATLASFAGTFVSPLVRRMVRDERVILALGAGFASMGALVAAVQQGRLGMLAATVTLAIASSAGRHAFDSVLQSELGDRARSRAFARADVALELAWVVGALLPTLLSIQTRNGYLAVAAIAVTAVVLPLSAGRHRAAGGAASGKSVAHGSPGS